MEIQEIKYSELNKILKAYFSKLYGDLFAVEDVESYLGEEDRYDWDGDRYFERAMIGHANELYTDESQRPNRHARIEYDYKAYVKGKVITAIMRY